MLLRSSAFRHVLEFLSTGELRALLLLIKNARQRRLCAERFVRLRVWKQDTLEALPVTLLPQVRFLWASHSLWFDFRLQRRLHKVEWLRLTSMEPYGVVLR